ncbi:TetR/AcrR family transcriptional regulator [Kribbella sp. NPDC003505]|uniref:TetR/AcrR family transcriptional regulator n=1 Tax=Kribbella sp. NPDC003505 TaxID=3154448 RepID=UPI0033A46470
MARPRTHSDEKILATVRQLLLEGGHRAVTTAAVSDRSGAPIGSVYHRFPSRDAMVAELWIRTIGHFHSFLLNAASDAPPGMDRALAVAAATIDYASKHPDNARLLAMANRAELRADPNLPSDTRSALEVLNRPVEQLSMQLAQELYGADPDRSALDRVGLAAFGVPYTVVRQRLQQDLDPSDLQPLVAKTVRAILEPEDR